ncbi:unnamed protein product [Pleuronectes platessa]|uniref:Uncharacterized protein n=1 Tax=Pleuronectes platessa TaxID=8262 RepID=A0A9N7TTC8_PLEPL|nr:unnamed protein product [Pleuronectes platessa]
MTGITAGTVDNRIFAWGNGTSGQLGDGEREVKDHPVEVKLQQELEVTGSGTSVNVVEIAGVACGSRHSFIWTQSGQAYSFGNNFYAQLGYDFQKADFKEHQGRRGGVRESKEPPGSSTEAQGPKLSPLPSDKGLRMTAPSPKATDTEGATENSTWWVLYPSINPSSHSLHTIGLGLPRVEAQTLPSNHPPPSSFIPTASFGEVLGNLLTPASPLFGPTMAFHLQQTRKLTSCEFAAEPSIWPPLSGDHSLAEQELAGAAALLWRQMLQASPRLSGDHHCFL